MPNVLTSTPADPGALYMGVEGGLVRWSAGEYSWIFKSEDDSLQVPYVYVRAVWGDPCDAKHLVFAGFRQAVSTVGEVFETNDAGQTFRHLQLPSSLPPFTSFEVFSGVTSSDRKTLVLGITLDRKNNDGGFNPPELERAYVLALHAQ